MLCLANIQHILSSSINNCCRIMWNKLYSTIRVGKNMFVFQILDEIEIVIKQKIQMTIIIITVIEEQVFILPINWLTNEIR